MALTIWLLGPPQVAVDGQPVSSLRSDKALALLAYLAVESDRAHRREKLAGLLWPDYTESSARTNLRRALADLRQAIGDDQAAPPYLLTTRETIQFNPGSDYRLDVEAFANPPDGLTGLEQAVALYRGSFVEGFSTGDAVPFEEWALLHKEQLERRLVRMLERLATAYEQSGEYERAEPFARRRIEVEPWNEEAQRQVMRLLALGRRRNAALAQYETCRRLLAEGLDVEPDPETTALYEAIRDGLLVAPAFITPTPAFVGAELQADAAATGPGFAGRERELAQLNGFLEQALAGRGRVAFVIGEPGSGKTVLVQEFVRRAVDAHPDLAAASGRCNAYTGIGDPYLPFLEILHMLTGDVEAGWAGGAITRAHARRLWALMPDAVQALREDGPELIDRFVSGGELLTRARTGAPHEVGRLAELLERRAASGPGTANLKQVDLFEQYTKVLAALSHRHPLILIVDDLQWADVGSIGLLFHLGRRLAGSHILLVGAYRPGDVAMGRPVAAGRTERHPLEPVIHEFQRDLGDIYVNLGQSEGRQFVDALLDIEPNCLDTGFREVLHRHTGGHPLFTVELLHGMQERGGLIKNEAGRWIAGPVLDWETLPPRVEAVIAERIGRLPEEWQSLLAAASIEGEEFTAEAVARVQAVDEGQVVKWLSGSLSREHRLVRAEGIERLGGQRLSRYRFRHFLFQKYLYNKLDPVRRAGLHEAIGQALEALHGEQAVELALPLARHFEAAGMTARAAEYLLLAGNRAARLFANEEAIAHYRRALALVEELPGGPGRVKLELGLQMGLAAPLVATKGIGSPEVGRAAGRAWELSQQMGDPPQALPVRIALWQHHQMRGELHTTLEIARQLADGGDAVAEALCLPSPGTLLGITRLFLADLKPAREHLEVAVARYDPERHHAFALIYGQDLGVLSLSFLSWALWLLGHVERSLARSHEAVELAQTLGHPHTLAWAFCAAARLAAMQRDAPAALELATAGLEIARERGLVAWEAAAMQMRGWARVVQGAGEEGEAELRRGIAAWQAGGGALMVPLALGWLAEAAARLGRVDEGLDSVADALIRIEKTGERFYEAEVRRLQGELLLAQGRCAEAEFGFWRAIEVARQHHARSLELRATLSLCRLWQKQGRYKQVRPLLEPSYAWFTEGFDTPDLQEAKTLLQELS